MLNTDKNKSIYRCWFLGYNEDQKGQPLTRGEKNLLSEILQIFFKSSVFQNWLENYQLVPSQAFQLHLWYHCY